MHRLLFVVTVLLVTAPTLAQRAAQLPWWDRAREGQAGAYWIKTDLPVDETRGLARHLNIMHTEYSKRLASLPQRGPEPLNVLIFKRREDYELTLRARYGVDARGTGGMFFVGPSGGGLAFWTGSLPLRRVHHVLQHEGFHQFAYSRFGGDLPIWVNEGLAEFFGSSIIVGDRLVLGQAQPRVLGVLRDAVERNQHLPFDRMLAMTPQTWSAAVRSGSASLQYHQAWSMVHFLVYGDGGGYVDAFERYLRLVNNGLPAQEAFYRAFRVDDDRDVADFEARWRAHVESVRPQAFITALERIEFLAEGARELSDRGVHPRTLEGVRDALREIGFTHTLAGHGLDVTLDAASDTLFLIPPDPRSEAPAFVIEAPSLRRTTRRERHLEETHPSPSTIRTEGLEPHGLTVRWTRDAEDPGAFTYQIDVR